MLAAWKEVLPWWLPCTELCGRNSNVTVWGPCRYSLSQGTRLAVCTPGRCDGKGALPLGSPPTSPQSQSPETQTVMRQTSGTSRVRAIL